MRFRFAVLGAACLAGLTMMAMRWMAPDSSADTPTEVARPRVAPAVATAPGRQFFDVLGAMPPQAAPAQPAADWRALETGFAKATSLRAFYYEALRKPGDGGYYYAAKAVASCSEARQDKSSVSSAQQQALDRIRARCDFSPQEYADARSQLLGLRQSQRENDPLLRMASGGLAAASDSETMAFMRSAIDAGNPEVIAILAGPAITAGLHEHATVDTHQLQFSAFLLACRLGADCGPGSYPALMLCASFGMCADSVDAALRAGYGAGYRRIDAVVNQVVDNIGKGDLEALVPNRFTDPHMPPPLPPRP